MNEENTRLLYEHQELDLDNNFYWFMNSDVELPYKNPKLEGLVHWWDENEPNNGLYWKGTRLYFTFEGVKYWLSWVFYDRTFINTAIKKLKSLGALNIALNLGELD